MLSRGMDCRLLTTADEFVQYGTGGQSTVRMHGKADGAAVIAHPNDGAGTGTTQATLKLVVVAEELVRCVSMRKLK